MLGGAVATLVGMAWTVASTAEAAMQNIGNDVSCDISSEACSQSRESVNPLPVILTIGGIASFGIGTLMVLSSYGSDTRQPRAWLTLGPETVGLGLRTPF